MESDFLVCFHIILKVIFKGLLQQSIGSTAEMSAWITKVTTLTKATSRFQYVRLGGFVRNQSLKTLPAPEPRFPVPFVSSCVT